MKKLLLVGGGHSDVPLIRAAQSLGYHVTTSGNRRQDLGHCYSDAFEPCDYSDRDAVLAIARKVGVDAICACCNDFSAISCAFVAKELGLPGHDDPHASEIIHHKDKWRIFADSHHIPSPKAIGCESLDDVRAAIAKLSFPLIVKPVDLTGGKGIQRCDTVESVLSAATDAFRLSKAKRTVVEEFITGSRHGLTTILRAGRVVFYLADNEHYHISQYLVSGASVPTSCSELSIDFLIGHCERVAKLLKLVDGIFHLQFIENEPGRPVIIEICRRAPGDLYVELVRYATGVPYAEWIVRGAAGVDLSMVSQFPVRESITRHCLMANKAGVFYGFDFDSQVERRIIDRLIWAKVGETVMDESTHKFGIVFIKNSSVEQMRFESPKLQELLRARVR